MLDRLGKGVWVYGHTTAKHSFKNPDVSEVHNGDGAKFRMLPDLFTAAQKQVWEDSLTYTDLWLRFPLMQHVDIIKELDAIVLVGTWSIPPTGRYEFKLKVVNGVYSSEESICPNPTGSVTDAATTRTGSWELDDELVITWSDATKETWARPIDPNGQNIRGNPAPAKRTARGKFGIVQG